MFGPLLKETPHFGVFGICRGAAGGPFERREFELLRCLMPHLQRALQISVRLNALEGEKGGLEDVLCRLTIGVAVLDATGRVILLNRVAEEIVAAADGLAVKDGRLGAATSGETTMLSRLIADAAATGAGIGTGAGGATTLSRPSLKRPLSLLIAPLCYDNRRWLSPRPAVAVFVSDPEHNFEPPTMVLRRLYGFTQTEAAIAGMIVQGHALKHAADRLGMTFETARSHMKVILDKSGTRRQAEFIKLALRGPASLRFD
jgi:DNA-binding CsgD family transcriptional regulator